MKRFLLTAGLCCGFTVTASALQIDVQTDTNIRDGSGVQEGGEIVQTRGTSRQGYYRFDLSGVTQPISAATLHVLRWDPDNSAHTLDLYGLDDGVNDSWNAATWQYSNAIKAGDAGSTLLANLDTSATAAPGPDEDWQVLGGVWLDIVLPASAVAFLNSDTNDLATFIVTNALNASLGEGKFYTVAKESDGLAVGTANDVTQPANPFGHYGAYLTVTEVPEPASLSLLAGSGLAMLARRRR